MSFIYTIYLDKLNGLWFKIPLVTILSNEIKRWGYLLKRLLFKSVVATLALCFFTGFIVAGAYAATLPNSTMNDYYNAILNKKTTPVYYSNKPAPPEPQTPPVNPPEQQTPSQPALPGKYPTSQPVNTINDYYNAILNKKTTPVYYSNNPTSPVPEVPPAPPVTPPVEPPVQPAPQFPEAPDGLTALETKVFELINSSRNNEGVRPVEIDMKLVELARLKARDMQENNYFGHVSPTYGTAGQMLRKFGVSFRSTGENLCKAGDVYKAHMLLLNSTSGHREIMLNPVYNKVGVAVVPQGTYVLVVEIFVQY